VKLRATNTAKWNLISNLLDDFHFNSNEERSVSGTEDVDMDDREQDEQYSSDRNITKDVFTAENNAILEITSPARVDESSISHVEVHAHLPFASATFNSNDEIRIAFNQQDLCVVLAVQKVLSSSGRATRRWPMYFPIRRSLPARL